MTSQTVQTVRAAALPRVNLMPQEVAEAARFRQLQLGMGAAVVLSAVAVAGLYMHERNTVSAAQSDLTTAQAQQTGLQSKLSSLQTVKDTYAAVQAKQQLLTDAMGNEIRWSYVLNDLSLRIPSDIWLSVVQATESTGTASTSTSTPAPTSLTGPTSYGTVSFSGFGLAHDDVARWLDAIAPERGFSDVLFSDSTETAIGSRTVYKFDSSVALTSKALSNRYTQKASS